MSFPNFDAHPASCHGARFLYFYTRRCAGLVFAVGVYLLLSQQASSQACREPIILPLAGDLTPIHYPSLIRDFLICLKFIVFG
jgi:hypothetical protein